MGGESERFHSKTSSVLSLTPTLIVERGDIKMMGTELCDHS